MIERTLGCVAESTNGKRGVSATFCVCIFDRIGVSMKGASRSMSLYSCSTGEPRSIESMFEPETIMIMPPGLKNVLRCFFFALLGMSTWML